jgi:hypothetical protein
MEVQHEKVTVCQRCVRGDASHDRSRPRPRGVYLWGQRLRHMADMAMVGMVLTECTLPSAFRTLGK